MEEVLLAAAGGPDELARLVYADWLEEQGRPGWESGWWRLPHVPSVGAEPRRGGAPYEGGDGYEFDHVAPFGSTIGSGTGYGCGFSCGFGCGYGNLLGDEFKDAERAFMGMAW